MIGYDPYNQDPSNFPDPLAQQMAQPVAMDNQAPAIPIQPPSMSQRFNAAVSGGLGRIGQGMFPVDSSIPPDQAKALQGTAMMRMGLGMLGAASSGARFGRALNAGYAGASNELQGAMQNAYHNALAKKQDDRAQTLMENTLENTKVDNARQQQQVDAQVETNRIAAEERRAQQKALDDQRKSQNDFKKQELELEKARIGLTGIPTGYRKKADGTLEYIPGGPADPAVATNNKTLRPVPATIAQGIVNNRQQIGKIDRALEELDKNPDAFGTQNYLPDALTQRLPGKGYSEGVDARAKVADIGSLVLHDRSGAAITASEFPRLKPFIPVATDDPKTIKTKLSNLRANISAMQEETEALYSPETGYRPLPQARESVAPAASGPAKVASDADYQKVPSGSQYIAPDGSIRTKR